MADIERREDYEEEFLAILLLIFATEPMGFWVNEAPSPRTMMRLLDRTPILGLADKVARQHTVEYLQELEWDNTPAFQRIAAESTWIALQYQWLLASRLADAHRDWLNERYVAGKTGDPLPGVADIYTEAMAKREAVTGLTTYVSQIEDAGKDFLERVYDLKTVRYWERDPRSNTCKACFELSGLAEKEWRDIFDGMPPRHPHCRCFVRNVRFVPAD